MAASYQCSGSVKTRSLCTMEQMASIQREQFKELPYAEALNYNEMMRQVAKSFDGGDTEEESYVRVVNPTRPLGSQLRYAHTVYDFQTILHRDTSPNRNGRLEMCSLASHILDQYVRELVRYANSLRRIADERRGRGRSPILINDRRKPISDRTTSESPLEDRTTMGYRIRGPCDVQKSCVMFTSDEFEAWGRDKHMTQKRVRGDFRAWSAEGQKFMGLDYVLIPYLGGKFHHMLLGMAPSQKFIFAIDSWGLGTVYSQEEKPMSLLLDAALTMIDPEAEELDWPIYGQWDRRGHDKLDGSPNVSQQGDDWNCGIFTATNAMCLAFGYDLLCYRQRDLENGPYNDLDPPRGKRARMAAELFQGLEFDPPFNYDLLDIPTKPPKEIPRGPIPPSHDQGAGPAPEEMEGIEQGAFEVEYENAADWPMQFSSKYFSRAGFIYKPNEEESDYWNPLQTKRELVQACKSRNVLGYEEWQEKEIQLFKRWIINYCTAIRKIYENDPLQPMEGLGRAVDLTVDHWARGWTPETDERSEDEGVAGIF